MIIQAELFWLCEAVHRSLIEGVQAKETLRCLAKRELELSDRALRIMDNMCAASVAHTREGYIRNGAFAHYVDSLLLLLQSIRELSERILVLSCSYDDSLDTKFKALNHSAALLVQIMRSKYKVWSNPAMCALCVASDGTFVTGARPDEFSLYPNYVWGSFTSHDTFWINKVSAGDCIGLSFAYLLDYVNIPEYLLDALVIASSDFSYEKTVQHLVEYVTSLYNAEEEELVQTEEQLSSLFRGKAYGIYFNKNCKKVLPGVIADDALTFKLQTALMKIK